MTTRRPETASQPIEVPRPIEVIFPALSFPGRPLIPSVADLVLTDERTFTASMFLSEERRARKVARAIVQQAQPIRSPFLLAEGEDVVAPGTGQETEVDR